LIWITTDGRPSNGAKALASQPGFRRLRSNGKPPKPNDLIINWGSTKLVFNDRLLNHPLAVERASNKLKAFIDMEAGGVQTVEWTQFKGLAQDWADENHVVVCRTVLTGHSGHGISIVDKKQLVPDAPLYTKYVFKDKEFRVHVVNNQVIDTQRKIKDPNREVLDWKVRSHENGFMYVRGNILPDIIRDELAIQTVTVLNLDFGAVDIIQDKHGKYYVLEVNTAPGLEGKTVELYAEAFRNATAV
jgi:hypothetical protein